MFVPMALSPDTLEGISPDGKLHVCDGCGVVHIAMVADVPASDVAAWCRWSWRGCRYARTSR